MEAWCGSLCPGTYKQQAAVSGPAGASPVTAGVAVGGQRYQAEGRPPLAGAPKALPSATTGEQSRSRGTTGTEELSLLWESGYDTFFAGNAKSMGRDMLGSRPLNQSVKANF